MNNISDPISFTSIGGSIRLLVKMNTLYIIRDSALRVSSQIIKKQTDTKHEIKYK